MTDTSRVRRVRVLGREAGAGAAPAAVRRSRALVVRVVAVLVLFVVWWLVALAKIWPPAILPSPGQVWHQLLSTSDAANGQGGYAGSTLVERLGVSLRRVGYGCLYGILIGVVLGLAMGLVPVIRAITEPAVTFLLAALELAGMDASTVTIVDLEPQNIQAAWQRGDIDGAYVWTPVLSVLQQDGVTLTDSAKLAAGGKPTLTFTVARKEFADANADVLDKWLAATDNAIKLIKTDPDTVAAAVSRQIGISTGDALSQLKQNIYLDHAEQRGPDYFGTADAPGRLADRLRDTADFLHQQKKVDEVPDLATFRAALRAPGAGNA